MHIIIKTTPGDGKTLKATPLYCGYDNTEAQKTYTKGAKEAKGDKRVAWYRKPAPYKSSRDRDPVTIEKPEPEEEPKKEPEKELDSGKEGQKQEETDPKRNLNPKRSLTKKTDTIGSWFPAPSL